MRTSQTGLWVTTLPRLAAVGLFAIACALCGCSKSDDAKAASAPPVATTAAAPSAGAPPAPEAPPPAPTSEAKQWTPSALDELLAPIALYPDPILAQVLAASTNAQEVLDAGNWLLDHQDLKGDDLTKAASDAGFTPSVQALVHFPTVMDMMCRELDWTRQLGDAFGADQAAVLASVQRLRAQAAAAGNLKTSPEMNVTKTEQNGQPVIVVQPANPQVVYVPQYNPQTVYAAPPPTTTTTTTTTSDSGISTQDAVIGGLLLFGAGVLVGNAIADNHNDHYCYPNWGYGGVYYGPRPYYPHNTFIYAPRYPGYRPTPYYRAPANYPYRYNNNYNNRYANNNNINRNINNNVNINNNNNYFNRFDGNRNRAPTYQPRPPINSPAVADRTSYRGSTTYNGADRPRPGTTPSTMPAARPGQGYAGREGQATPTGSYRGNAQTAQAGQRPMTTQGNQGPRISQASQQRYTGAGGTNVDRGYPRPSGNRSDAGATQKQGGSFAGVSQGSRDRAASDRGRSSMKSATRPSQSQSQRASRGGGGGGGGSRAGGGGGGGSRAGGARN